MEVIASTIIRREFKHELYMKTKKAMELAGFNEKELGNKILLKPDCRTERVLPGACTSPWVLESVIRVIQKQYPDSELFLCEWNMKALENWGLAQVCKNYNVKIIDLEKEKQEKYNGLYYPKIALAANNIINIPVAGVNHKGISGCMQNQLSITNENTKSILKVNRDLLTDFVVIDATVCGEGAHPYMSVPKVRDTIIAGKDVVAADNALCTLAGVKQPGYLKKAEEKEMGTSNYKLIGSLKGKNLTPKGYPANPLTRDMVAYFWYKFKGRKIAQKILKHPLYGQEFKELF